ncbi:hypothetical protein [Streptomyces sp. SID1046]|uniref:hypothetical protein n=1 Tax=Streptomyces sp. SID1046 TaxID=2690249 RepID=UPI0031BA52AF
MSSTSLSTNPRPAPTVEAAASVYVLQVREFVDEAAMPAVVSGTFVAERRIHLSAVVSSTGSVVFFARCAFERHRASQYRAC